jgi:hypothetical protein
MAEVMK